MGRKKEKNLHRTNFFTVTATFVLILPRSSANSTKIRTSTSSSTQVQMPSPKRTSTLRSVMSDFWVPKFSSIPSSQTPISPFRFPRLWMKLSKIVPLMFDAACTATSSSREAPPCSKILGAA